MTQEEKAKRYDEVVNEIRNLRDMLLEEGVINKDGVICDNFNRIFPELKEGEDERIRKSLCKAIWTYIPTEEGQEYIAWLEKQEGCEHIKKDWLEHIKQSWYKEGFIDGKYSDKTPVEWTVNDATTLNELIDFLTKGTAKLQHDLTRYANWLKIKFTPIEKQGEQKPYNQRQECVDCQFNYIGECKGSCAMKRGEQKPADKIEPKFHEGEWVVHNKANFVFQVVSIGSYGYEVINRDNYTKTISFDNEVNYHLWTIQDAKDGDVLYTPKGCGVEGIFLIEGWKQVDDTGRTLCSDIGYRVEDDKIIAGGLGAIWWKGVIDPFYPATKEQRDLLFSKMKEAGYEWDAEKKELNKIEQKPADKIEPKFKVGDKITEKDFNECGCGTIIDIKDGKYIFDNGGFVCIEEQGLWQLVEQKPVDKVEPKFKVGDIMRTLQEVTDNITSGLPVVVSIDEEYYHCTNELIAIKDQDDYEYPPMNRRQKPAWSEEDNIILSRIIADYERSNEEWFNAQKSLPHGRKITWLKSLKDRCLPQPKQEILEKLEEWLDEYVSDLADVDTASLIGSFTNYLDGKLPVKPKNRWKPSDEQIEILDMVLTNESMDYNVARILRDIREQLKKLRQE